mgnify:FL=1
MFKNLLIISFLILLTNCTAPGSAFLGPVFTGATTKSAAQASISFGTNQILKKLNEASKTSKTKISKIAKKIENFSKNQQNQNLFKFHN